MKKSDMVREVIVGIVYIHLVIILCGYLILLAIYHWKTDSVRKEYIKTLNEHDSKVVNDYLATEYKIFKKKHKKVQ